MILRDAGRLVFAGIAIGVPAAWASARIVESFLFGVCPANLATTLFCCVVVLSVSIVAGLVPARRAAHIDPISFSSMAANPSSSPSRARGRVLDGSVSNYSGQRIRQRLCGNGFRQAESDIC